MRIAIVGASGFIGRHACGAALSLGHDLVAISRREAVDSTEYLRIRIDSAHPGAFAEAFSGCHAVLNLAGTAHLPDGSGGSRSILLAEGNQDLPRAVAIAAREAGVNRVVHLSSAGVLGRNSFNGPFDDNSAPDPYDDYTKSKLIGEQAIESELTGSEVEFTSVRPPMVYGPGAPGNFALIATWLGRGLPLPLGSCDARRAMISVRNLCELLLFLVTTKHALPRSVLCRDNETMSVSEFAFAVAGSVASRSIVFSVPPSVLKLMLVVCGRAELWHRLGLPFELDVTGGLSRLGWNAKRRAADEIVWSLSR